MAAAFRHASAAQLTIGIALVLGGSLSRCSSTRSGQPEDSTTTGGAASGVSGGGAGGVGGSAATGIGGSGGEPCFAPGSEVNSDPTFLGCVQKSWDYRFPDACTPAVPLPTSTDGAAAVLIVDQSRRVGSGLELSAGTIQFSVAGHANPVAVSHWIGSGYELSRVQDDLLPGELLLVKAPGSQLPAFEGELPIPPHVQLALPALWVQVQSEQGVDAGSQDAGSQDAGSRDAGSRDAGSQDAGSQDVATVGDFSGNPGVLRWSSDTDDGVLEFELHYEFWPDARVWRTYLFCRVALSAHELIIPRSTESVRPSQGRVRVVVTASARTSGAAVRLHAERVIATIPGIQAR